MKRYDQSNQIEVTNLINTLNGFNPNIQVASVSGLLLNRNKQFSAIVEYYEINTNETLNDVLTKNDFQVQQILSKELSIPFFVIVYNSTNCHSCYDIFDYNNRSWFTKSYTVKNNTCDFAIWWSQYKGTVQTKPYIKKQTPFHIINTLIACDLRWGGDVDGIVYDKKYGFILSICEFRCATKCKVSKYDPNVYYSSDIMTWYPLILLKKELFVPLYLVTMSTLESGYGIAGVINGDKSTLVYRFNKKPNDITLFSANDIFNFISLT